MRKIIAIIFCLILGVAFSVQASGASKEDLLLKKGEDFKLLLDEVDLFVEFDSETNLVTIDETSAKNNGVSSEAIELAKRFFDGQNFLISTAIGREFTESEQDFVDSYMEEFTPLFEYIANGFETEEINDEEMNQYNMTASVDNELLAYSEDYIQDQIDLVFDYVSFDEEGIASIDIAKARKNNVPEEAIEISNKAFDYQNKVLMELKEPNYSPYWDIPGGCGGNVTKPHRCPPRLQMFFRIAYHEAVSHLKSAGYHGTSWPYGGALPWNPNRDFTKVVNAYNCNNGPFRTQAILSDKGRNDGYYTVYTQSPEPNPEVTKYIGPKGSYMWLSYVYWWHMNYC
ncbi:hypothetical protein KHA93_22965 [Bacillus sp. FJAT-49732]|uniref:Uncharacterized protein n=1 Tax=Lederbergia citrisecunda TaxID=2833583 RepID=A0A942TS16_9BACI|nr:hypothetical protein [Lederbergia citrisecunda]MBS4202468.1 hypothetical protein [Lederbergia citrisecunda]